MSANYHKVLIVEDEAMLRSIIARNLSARGHEVAEAGTVSEARAYLASERPDLLLLDINLPDRTGWDILRYLKDQGEGDQIPVVIVSAVSLNPARLAEFRPLAYLPKPFPLSALTRIVAGEPAQEEQLAG